MYEPGSSQEAVFADVEPVVTSVMDGYNVCIFAYGQTGTLTTFVLSVWHFFLLQNISLQAS